MGGLFGGGSPAPVPTPVVPTVADPAVQAAAEATRVASAQAGGRAATISTGGQGDTSTATLFTQGLKPVLGA